MNKSTKILLWFVNLIVTPILTIFSLTFLGFYTYKWLIPLIFANAPIINFGQAFALMFAVVMLVTNSNIILTKNIITLELHLKQKDPTFNPKTYYHKELVINSLCNDGITLALVWLLVLVSFIASYIMPYIITFLNWLY